MQQNGSIFKNDFIEEPAGVSSKPSVLSLLATQSQNNSTGLSDSSGLPAQLNSLIASKKTRRLKRKDRLRELQQFYYGYAITKHNRHLGLVRRRVGRGGR